jgi:hypothetical protein
MIRSTRAQKAERLTAARRLLATGMGMAEAAMTLSRKYGLSRRQAYRYLKLVRAGSSAPAAPERAVTITFKVPSSAARNLRVHARERGVTTSELLRRALAAFLATPRPHG